VLHKDHLLVEVHFLRTFSYGTFQQTAEVRGTIQQVASGQHTECVCFVHGADLLRHKFSLLENIS
jgi:hypothetical protein